MESQVTNVTVEKEPENKKNVTVEKESENEKFFNKVNDSYGKRVEETEHFSKHMFNLCADLNTEFLHDCLNIAQHYADMQKKHSDNFSRPLLFSEPENNNWRCYFGTDARA